MTVNQSRLDILRFAVANLLFGLQSIGFQYFFKYPCDVPLHQGVTCLYISFDVPLHQGVMCLYIRFDVPSHQGATCLYITMDYELCGGVQILHNWCFS